MKLCCIISKGPLGFSVLASSRMNRPGNHEFNNSDLVFLTFKSPQLYYDSIGIQILP